MSSLDQATSAPNILTIDRALLEANNHYQANRLADAERLYRAILEIQPKHPDANHNLGMLAVGIGKPAEALLYLKAAVEAAPTKGEFWIDYIDALIKADQWNAARQVIEQGQRIGLKGGAVDELIYRLTQSNAVAEATHGCDGQEHFDSAVEDAAGVPTARKAIKAGSPSKRPRQIPAPAAGEISAVVKHFNNGQFELVKKLALDMTRTYPRHPFGWKVLGAVLHQAGNLAEALVPMMAAIELMPGDAELQSNYGNVLLDLGRLEEAANGFRKAIALQPSFAGAHSNLGVALKELGRLAEAETCLRRAITLNPKFAKAWNNLGNTLKDSGRPEEAVASYRKAIALQPDFADAHSNLGVVLNRLGRLVEAEACYRQAISLKPNFAKAWNNLGNTLKDSGRLKEAVASYRKAIALQADFADAYNNLGITLYDLELHEEAEICCRRAIELKPDFAEAHGNLGSIFSGLGRLGEALTCYQQAIKLKSSLVQGKIGYAHCISKMRFEVADPSICATTAMAITEAWTRPYKFSKVACNLLLLNPAINELLDSVKKQERCPNGLFQELADSGIFARLGNDRLLTALLTSTPVANNQLEQLFTAIRHLLADDARNAADAISHQGPTLAFFSALAQQCFINEYVFSCTEGEINTAIRLRDELVDALECAKDILPHCIIAVACYFPLNSVAKSDRLLDRNWPEEINRLLAQQILEPLEELKLRSAIPLLTPIDDGVSAAVRNQYEENPYPRWIRAPLEVKSNSINAYLQGIFPGSKIQGIGNGENPDILIAGCGTGQQPISVAQHLINSRLLAIDLSMASLSYAKRKSQELGIENIEYAQADILKLDTLGRTFDVIESTGVLHHLENPFDGWRRLLSLLRPNGLMRLGFYSQIARRDVVRARKLIEAKGYSAIPDDIRAARQYLREADRIDSLGLAIQNVDFYSLSTCRDLLFHVQEHRMTLDAIRQFIAENDLAFLGFEIDPSIAGAYRRSFPADSSATCLENWHVFEQDNPDTFVGMYQFWVQRKY